MSDERLPSDFPSLPLTPSAFLEMVAARLDRLHGADAASVQVRGIPTKGGSGKVYSGFVYADLRDPRTTDAITAKIPEPIANDLEWGREAVFTGLIHFVVRRGELRPELRVDRVGEGGERQLLSKDELMARWSEAIVRPKRDVRAALSVPKPRLVVITGVGSVAADDIRAQLQEAESELDLQVVRVSMSRPEEVARALRQAADAHAVAITRGGGQSVHDLDTDELIGAVASSPVPVLVALGHAVDDLVVGRVADAAFPTPTALGRWLRDVIDQKRSEARRLEEAQVLTRSEDLLRRLDRFQAAQSGRALWRTAALVLLVLWAGTILWLVFGR